ncbi:hypothetical protein NITMOv2_0396 [Nitrospira moscoviensis]|uniref:Uncharacterized protein n=1 Tax=Nitrospira moscoviensis TaxID=42253 RepID=A0A0K2G8A4_NITMO|nr:hypothetical protein NITMOv2_0396 [Nitrospira moscoviensis]
MRLSMPQQDQTPHTQPPIQEEWFNIYWIVYPSQAVAFIVTAAVPSAHFPPERGHDGHCPAQRHELARS